MHRSITDETIGVTGSPQNQEHFPSDGLTQQPGALRGEVWMTLHTRYAQRIFAGRTTTPERPAIIGLTRFSTMVSQLVVCVQADDPYADWWLVKIEEALEESASQIELLRQTIQAKLASTAAIDIAIAASLQPIRVPLQFRNPYAYSAARLIAHFDILARGLLTARHVGLLDRPAGERYLLMGARAVRRALSSAQGYRYNGVTREDLRENNAKAQAARVKMGELPPDIVEGTRVARFAPVKASPAASTRRRPGLRMADLDTAHA